MGDTKVTAKFLGDTTGLEKSAKQPGADPIQKKLGDATKDKGKYAGVLKGLLLEGFYALNEESVHVRARKVDKDTVVKAIKEAEKEYKEELSKARHEAAKIREEAREQGAAIISDMRKQAQDESERILRHGRSQLEAERSQVAPRHGEVEEDVFGEL